jgi:tetratricopeptide (TPR) repeat protein
MRLSVLSFVFLLLQISAPPDIPQVPRELLTRPVARAAGIGHAHDSVGTSSAPAQQFYDQGIAYLHSYVWIEAARAFNAALRADPSLAVAHAQLSLALTELNLPSDARAALARARALAPQATAHDRRHIELRALQFAAEEQARNAAALTAYRAALDAAVAAFPRDAEFWLLRGNAESPDPADRGQGSVAGSIRFYDRARSVAPADDAPLHFLTHAYENSRDEEKALATSEAYAKAAPAIPHAHHMLGHVRLERGRVADAIAAFEAADRVERAYLSRAGVPAEYEWHHEHNLDLLGASYAYVGRMHEAEDTLKTAFALPTALAVQAFNKRNYPALLTSRGRAADARTAASTLVAHPSSFARVAGHIEEARALMASQKFAESAQAANDALREMRASPPAGAFASLPFAALQGEYLVRTGQRARGEPMLRQAVRNLRMLTGPDAHMETIFTLDALAHGMRDAGAWDLALWLADQMLESDAQYAGSQFAKALALEHAGDATGARTAFAAAARLWSSADASLPELQAAKQKVR